MDKKLKDLTKEDLELLGYDDIAYLILSESTTKQKLPTIFKKICKLLELEESAFEDKIGDFFQMMSVDHRFIMLPKGYWDLKTRQKSNIIIDPDEDDEEDLELLDETEDDTDIIEPEEDEENYYDDDQDETDDPDEDDLKDLVIVGEDEEDEANVM